MAGRVGVLFELEGLRGFEAALARVGEAVRQLAARVVRDTALAIMRAARLNAPRDRGDLARNISAQGRELTWRVGILDVSIPSRGGTNSAHLNPWVYGVWYEYGFVTRQIEAKPYMGPAAESQRESHVDRMVRAVNTAVGRAT